MNSYYYYFLSQNKTIHSGKEKHQLWVTSFRLVFPTLLNDTNRENQSLQTENTSDTNTVTEERI